MPIELDETLIIEPPTKESLAVLLDNWNNNGTEYSFAELIEKAHVLAAENIELKQAIQSTLDTGMDRYIREAIEK